MKSAVSMMKRAVTHLLGSAFDSQTLSLSNEAQFPVGGAGPTPRARLCPPIFPMESISISVLRGLTTTFDGVSILGLSLFVTSLLFSSLLLFKIAVALLDSNRRIPGPFLARFTRLWLLFQYRTGRYHEIQHALHQKYGPIWRQAPGVYSVNSPDAIRTLYSHGAKFAKVRVGSWLGRGSRSLTDTG